MDAIHSFFTTCLDSCFYCKSQDSAILKSRELKFWLLNKLLIFISTAKGHSLVIYCTLSSFWSFTSVTILRTIKKHQLDRPVCCLEIQFFTIKWSSKLTQAEIMWAWNLIWALNYPGTLRLWVYRELQLFIHNSNAVLQLRKAKSH